MKSIPARISFWIALLAIVVGSLSRPVAADHEDASPVAGSTAIPLVDFPLPANPVTPFVSMWREDLAPDARRELPRESLARVVLLVRSGLLTVSGDAFLWRATPIEPELQETPVAGAIVLTVDQAVVVEPTARYEYRAGPDGAELLGIAIASEAPALLSGDAASLAVAGIHPIFTLTMGRFPLASGDLELSYVDLPAGTAFERGLLGDERDANDPEFLVVESGVLEVAATKGRVQVVAGGTPAQSDDPAAFAGVRLATGDTLALHSRSTADARAPGPDSTRLLVLRLNFRTIVV